MLAQKVGRRLLSVACVAAPVVSCAAFMGAASAETYRAPNDAVVVGTFGSDAGQQDIYSPVPLLAVTHGGCADGWVTLAVGENNRYCGWSGKESQGLVAVGLLGADSRMLAVGGGDTFGVVSVSDTGPAEADCVGPIPWGDWRCAEPGIAVSGTGSATGAGSTVSGTGPSHSDWQQEGNDFWAVASVSGMGDARGGNVAVSGTGDAHGHSHTTYRITGGPVTYPGLAVSGAGEAHGGVVSVGMGDASATGGIAAVSLTGNASGGSVANVCPMGRCN